LYSAVFGLVEDGVVEVLIWMVVDFDVFVDLWVWVGVVGSVFFDWG